jgi:hypothetical protein
MIRETCPFFRHWRVLHTWKAITSQHWVFTVLPWSHLYESFIGSVEKSRQRRSLPSPERLRVYALKHFDAQARRQVAIFPCSRIQHTLRA